MTVSGRAKMTRPFLIAAMALFCLAFLLVPGKILADNVVQGFAEKGDLQPGWVVAIDNGSNSTVVAAPANDPSRIYGVVINPSSSPITLNRSGEQVFVANADTYPVLVSAANGPIAVGDYISMSTTDGIGAKATTDQQYILGQATQAFDGVNNVITGSGSSAVGRINVRINPGHNPMLKNSFAVPAPIKNAAEAVAGHNVSNSRIWAAVIIFVAAAAVAVILLIVGVRGGMVAIGRNPLSRHSILYGLFQIIGLALAIFVVGLFGVYLLLRL